MRQVFLASIRDLKEHEEVDEQELEKLLSEIKSQQIIKKPIIVDRKTGLVLDGHVRLNALKKLGCVRVPVIYVDYDSEEIRVEAWREGETVSKDDVLRIASTGSKMPPKTSRHTIKIQGRARHLSTIVKEINVSLKRLLSNAD